MYNKICSTLLATYCPGRFYNLQNCNFLPLVLVFWLGKKNLSIQLPSTRKTFTVKTELQCRKGFHTFPAFCYCTYQPHKSHAISATSPTVKEIMARTALSPNRWETGYKFFNFLHISLFLRKCCEWILNTPQIYLKKMLFNMKNSTKIINLDQS